MTLDFIALEQPDAAIITDILNIEQEALGEGALNEYVVVPMLRYGKVYAAVDEQDNAVACAYFMRSMDDTDTAYLVSVAVLPMLRGQNVGTALLEYALSHLKQYGIMRVMISVDPANVSALAVYREQLGFSVVDTVQDEFGPGEDRLVMSKKL